jgi:starvation-inducible DNA-binding protein
MANPTASKKTKNSTGGKKEVIDNLQENLNKTFSLFLLTYNYHWNVEGQSFVSLHELFEKQYTELFSAVDTIAEHIRSLENYAMPDHYSDIFRKIADYSNPLVKAGSQNASVTSSKMIKNLIDLNEEVIASAQSTKEAADEVKDDETVDLMVDRIRVHQKAAWMLKSCLKT